MPEAGGLVGTQAILHAAPDGRTIGMINASGLLAAALAGEKRAPNPASAFTLLGCVARAYHVWVTRRDSSLRTMEDVFAENRTRPVVFGTREVGSSSFVDAALTAHVLGLHIDIVGGYTGSNDTVLAAMRREVDIVTHTLEAVVDHIENGDLRPLLQIGVSRRFAHPVLADVPLLGGTEGVAARRARQTGRPVEAVLDDVDALVRLIGAGRLVAGPPGIPPDLSACMGSALLEALQGADFQRRARDAGLSLDIASGEEAYEALQAVSRKFDRFAPVIRTAIRKVRE
jgi:tripartite-type tricarboxylate transporter receptor subunit TctC